MTEPKTLQQLWNERGDKKTIKVIFDTDDADADCWHLVEEEDALELLDQQETQLEFYQTKTRERGDLLEQANKKIAVYERALDRITATAGHPDASEGCRLVIRLATEALDRAKG